MSKYLETIHIEHGLTNPRAICDGDEFQTKVLLKPIYYKREVLSVALPYIEDRVIIRIILW
jgi:hypothetical protein